MDATDTCTAHCSRPFGGQRYCGTSSTYTGQDSIDCTGCAPDPNLCPQDCFAPTCSAGSSGNGGTPLLDMHRCTDSCSQLYSGKRYCGTGSAYTGEGSIQCSGCAKLSCSYREAKEGEVCLDDGSPYELTKIGTSKECSSASQSLGYQWQETLSSNVPGGCYVNDYAAKMSFKSGASLAEMSADQLGLSMLEDDSSEGRCPDNKYKWMGEVLLLCQEEFGPTSVWDVKRGTGTYCQYGFDKCITPYYVECCTRPTTTTTPWEFQGSWSEVCRICSIN